MKYTFIFLALFSCLFLSARENDLPIEIDTDSVVDNYATTAFKGLKIVKNKLSDEVSISFNFELVKK